VLHRRLVGAAILGKPGQSWADGAAGDLPLRCQLVAVVAVAARLAGFVVVEVVADAKAEAGPRQFIALLPVTELDAALGILDGFAGGLADFRQRVGIRLSSADYGACLLQVILHHAFAARSTFLHFLGQVEAAGLEDHVFGGLLGRHLRVVDGLVGVDRGCGGKRRCEDADAGNGAQLPGLIDALVHGSRSPRVRPVSALHVRQDGGVAACLVGPERTYGDGGVRASQYSRMAHLVDATANAVKGAAHVVLPDTDGRPGNRLGPLLGILHAGQHGRADLLALVDVAGLAAEVGGARAAVAEDPARGAVGPLPPAGAR